MRLQRKRRHFRSRFAEDARDVEAAQRFRYACFHGGQDGIDRDEFDAACQHLLVEDAETGALICTFRFMELPTGAEIGKSYSSQYYELSNLHSFDKPLLEMGRFCISPEVKDPNVLRMAWAEITRLVDDRGIEMLFGCSSFQGIDETEYEDAFALLKERHLGPKRLLPHVKAPNVFDFARKLKLKKPNLKRAQQGLPPLLRTYLTMGGWVSDHAVVDTQMNTLHVFTGVEIAAIPPARKRLLRADVS